MPLSFLDLPFEIRSQIYENLLVCPVDYIHVRTTVKAGNEDTAARLLGDPLDLCSAILRTNSLIRDEATSILYGRNGFLLATLDGKGLPLTEHALVRGFLDLVGHRNAAEIRHVSIALPTFSDLHEGHIVMDNHSEEIFDLLRERCTSLQRIETEMSLGFSSFEKTLERALVRDEPHIADEALAVFDARFRAIPSLESRVYNIFANWSPGSLMLQVKMELELGWELCGKPRTDWDVNYTFMPGL